MKNSNMYLSTLWSDGVKISYWVCYMYMVKVTTLLVSCNQLNMFFKNFEVTFIVSNLKHISNLKHHILNSNLKTRSIIIQRFEPE